MGPSLVSMAEDVVQILLGPALDAGSFGIVGAELGDSAEGPGAHEGVAVLGGDGAGDAIAGRGGIALGGGGAGCDQVALPGMLQMPPRLKANYARRSMELLEHAREVKAARDSASREQASQASLKTYRDCMHGVASLLPGLSGLAGKASVAVGRLKPTSLLPHHFAFICRAAFMKATTNVQVGVKLKRVIAAAARLITDRQQTGFSKMVHNAGRARAHAIEGQHRFVHLTHHHMWDEVHCKFVWHKNNKFRKGHMNVHVPTIVQRGGVCWTAGQDRAQTSRSWWEHWLVAPQTVEGTSAAALWPAVTGALPKAGNFMDVNAMDELMRHVDSYCFQTVCDKASGNLLLLRQLCSFWTSQLRDRHGGRIRFWPETCGIHLHHRMKLQVRALAWHVNRQFSICNLIRLQDVRSNIFDFLEKEVPLRVQGRICEPRPADLPGDLATFIDILYDMRAPHHDRKAGGKSQEWHDLCFLSQMLSGNMLGEWRHYCWDTKCGRPCCKNLAETKDRTLRAVVGALFATADPIPAESRWTHTLPNMKKCLLRKVCYNIGLDCFPGAIGEALAALQVDGQVQEDFFKKVHRSRLQRAASYFADAENMYQLGVLTIVLKLVDKHLLYPMLGDPISSKDGPSKLDLLLDPEKSFLGVCTQGLLRLLDTWLVGGPSRDPWMVLELLGADCQSHDLAFFARCQILRMASSVSRRYVLRYCSWPYLLYQLFCTKVDAQRREEVAEQLLAASAIELDVYSQGVRREFNTLELLLSHRCRVSLAADFRSLPYSTDLIERLNAEVTRATPVRSRGRSFNHASRESLLRQLLVTHVSRGGKHPLTSEAMSPTATKEICTASPLLPVQDVAPARLPTTRPPDAGQLVRYSDQSPAAVLPASSAQDSLVPHAPIAFGAAAQSIREIVPLLPQDVSPAAGRQGQTRRGLSPYMLECNKTLAAAKARKGRPLSQAEVDSIRQEFKSAWPQLRHQPAFLEAYRDWQQVPAARPEALCYTPSWGGGCCTSPLTAEEFWAWQQDHGWPSDDDVFGDDSAEFDVHACAGEEFDSSVRIWGIGREAKNVDRSTIGDASAQENRDGHHWAAQLGHLTRQGRSRIWRRHGCYVSVS